GAQRPAGARRLSRRVAGRRRSRRRRALGCSGPAGRPAVSALLELQGVWAGYGGSDVLRDLTFSVPAGSVTCVVGPNGAGKSTILRVVSGQVSPRLGTVTFDGQRISGRNPRQILALGIVQVAQSHSLFPDMSVRENVEMGG